MQRTSEEDDKEIRATPTKQFFVGMMTRDIELHDAILDLLDNCVDGIVRTIKGSATGERPYQGYWAKITLDHDHFSIEDNCGGIPPKIARNYAFRMGRPVGREDDRDMATVGIYGIGMKRAIFKMGMYSQVVSKHGSDSYQVTIDPEWLASDESWFLSMEEPEETLADDGTRITVSQLHSAVANRFAKDDKFIDDLYSLIATHYTYIIQKGFKVFLNGDEVVPKPLTVMRSDFEAYAEGRGIMPYVYEGEQDGVSVRLVVGFLARPPGESEIEDEMERPRRSKEEAGWTVIANERVVLYKDKSRVTGWGTGNVPAYHPQFITVSGVVEFRCDQAEKLPINTTKRGLEAGDELYLHVRDFMMEGMRIFTQHTNRWKQHKEEELALFESARREPVRDVAKSIPEDRWTRPRNSPTERKFVPDLPRPKTAEHGTRQIRFARPLSQIKTVAEYLFEDPDAEPRDVGEKCFDLLLDEARDQ